ncbi:SDR family NAD(P)-dependent oxidoreductase [Porphyromonas pogonae]|uniref:SDR family NAD(P)-dependent oxidoreductase n=1 Tax=Porphyromonas pogonae TaxID=867595 RepID=UPI002E76C8CF|nr:SDR family NAD(P)-dependent oxidoreductase [Porphyromonas pogonae]
MIKYPFLNKILFPPVKINRSKLRKKIKGKTIVITGATYGIGEALTWLLAGRDVHLVLVARTEEKLRQIKRVAVSKGATVDIFAIDLRMDDQRKRLIDALCLYSEGIDILINNAGISIKRSLMESQNRFHDVTRTTALNYFASVDLCLGLLTPLQHSSGHIINISALNVLLPPAPHWAAYQASKCASDQWFRASAPEMRMYGIDTSMIYLPLVRTRMISATEMYRDVPAMAPQRAADLIAQAIINRKRTYKPWWFKWVKAVSVLLLPLWERQANRLFLKKTHE